MVGEQYYLCLKTKDGVNHLTLSSGVSLEEIDKRTTNYNNKRELIKQILSVRQVNFKIDDVVDVQIYRKPNSKKEEYKEEKGPLYKKDKEVLNTNSTLAKFELKVHDPKFVLYFLKPFAKTQGLKNAVSEIIGLINANENYMDELSDFLNKIIKTYKSYRNVYISMQYYDTLENSKKYRKESKKTDSEDYVPVFNDDELKEMELEYLKKYDRELLDIDDFNRYQDISPFDGNKHR